MVNVPSAVGLSGICTLTSGLTAGNGMLFPAASVSDSLKRSDSAPACASAEFAANCTGVNAKTASAQRTVKESLISNSPRVLGPNAPRGPVVHTDTLATRERGGALARRLLASHTPAPPRSAL